MSLTSSQQKQIRSYAQKIKATIQIGKHDITGPLVQTIIAGLEANELVKIHLLPNAPMPKTEVISTLHRDIQPEYIYSIGNKIILYKMSSNPQQRHLSNEIIKIS